MMRVCVYVMSFRFGTEKMLHSSTFKRISGTKLDLVDTFGGKSKRFSVLFKIIEKN